jgi:hypothetical protein
MALWMTRCALLKTRNARHLLKVEFEVKTVAESIDVPAS